MNCFTRFLNYKKVIRHGKRNMTIKKNSIRENMWNKFNVLYSEIASQSMGKKLYSHDWFRTNLTCLRLQNVLMDAFLYEPCNESKS